MPRMTFFRTSGDGGLRMDQTDGFDVVFTYTREQAIAAAEAGIFFRNPAEA